MVYKWSLGMRVHSWGLLLEALGLLAAVLVKDRGAEMAGVVGGRDRGPVDHARPPGGRRPGDPRRQVARPLPSRHRMTSDRAQAYGRVMRTIREDGPTALSPAECALLREAADSLLFCESLADDDEAREALTRAGDLAGDLVASGRWGPDRAEQLLRDIECCGPMAAVS